MKDIVIRLKPIGYYKYKVYEIVVVHKKTKLNGGYIEKIGFLNPNPKEKFFFINSFRLGFWLNRGVSLRPSVCKYLAKFLARRKMCEALKKQ